MKTSQFTLFIPRELKFMAREGFRGNEFNVLGLFTLTTLYLSAPMSPAHQSLYYLLLRLGLEEPITEKPNAAGGQQGPLASNRLVYCQHRPFLIFTRIKLFQAEHTMPFPLASDSLSTHFQSQSRKEGGSTRAGTPVK